MKVTEISISGQTIVLEDEYKFEEEVTNTDTNEEQMSEVCGEALENQPKAEAVVTDKKQIVQKIVRDF